MHALVLYVHKTRFIDTDVHCMIEGKNLCVYVPFIISGSHTLLSRDSSAGSVIILGCDIL